MAVQTRYLLAGRHLSLVTAVSGGDDRIRTCEGLLTLNGLANRRLQPLGHISVPNQAKTHSSLRHQIVKMGTVQAVQSSSFSLCLSLARNLKVEL